MLHFPEPFFYAAGPWTRHNITITEMLTVLCIEAAMYHAFVEWVTMHQPQQAKLIGTLFQFRAAYWFYPMDLGNLGFESYQFVQASLDESVHIWAWKAWMQISKQMHFTMNPLLNLAFKSTIMPICWICLRSTDNVCKKCKNKCIDLRMRPIPTCNHCQVCRACDFELMMNDTIEDDGIIHRYSFHLSLFLDQAQSTTFSDSTQTQTAYRNHVDDM